MIVQSRAVSCCIAIVMVAWAPMAVAAPGLEACVEIDEDAARLECYDRVAGRASRREPTAVAGAASAAPTAPMPVSAAAPVAASVPAAPAAADVARDFGLSDADVKRRDAEQGAESPPKSITRTVESVSRDAYDRFVITLDDGQVWAQTEQKSGTYPRPGDSVTITQGPMGGFGLRSERFGTVRVRRLK